MGSTQIYERQCRKLIDSAIVDNFPAMKETRDQTAKADSKKLRMELIPFEVLEELAKVLTYGAEKYSAHSWKKVEKDPYQGALLRHFSAYMRGQVTDSESGLTHISHVLCNAVFLVSLEMESEK